MLCATVTISSLEVKFIQAEWKAMARRSGADAAAQSLTCGATAFPAQRGALASETAMLLERRDANQRQVDHN